MNEIEITTIQLQKETRERLKAFGGKDDTYDTILTKLMNNQSTPKKIDSLPKSTEQDIDQAVDSKLKEQKQSITNNEIVSVFRS